MIVVDPGASGGIITNCRAFGNTPTAFRMPDTEEALDNILRESLGPADTDEAFIEDLVKYAGRNMPSSRMAVYAANWGYLRGFLRAIGYKVILVPPKKWQAALGLGTAKGLTKTQWKNKLKDKAQELFPQIKVTLATADALLIYEAARRNLLG